VKHYLLLLVLVLPAACDAADLYIFTRPGCPPCERLKQALKADPSLTEGFDVFLIDTQKNPSIATRMRVGSVPTVVIQQDNAEVDRKVGWSGEQAFRAWLKREK
jgi:thioredoxin-like negative regulator of GroEL